MVTSDDRGPLIEVSAYLLLSSSILATIIKVVTKILIARKLQGDDWFAISAVVCKHFPRVHRACLTVTRFWPLDNLSLASNKSTGVLDNMSVPGQLEKSLPMKRYTDCSWMQRFEREPQTDKAKQAGYAAELQYILAIALTKMVTLHFLATLARERRKKLYVKAAVSCNAIWALVAFLVVAFQCEAPRVWAITSGVCVNRVSLSSGLQALLEYSFINRYQPAFWTVLSTIDILVDVAVTALPIIVLYTLQVTWARKMNTIVAFGGRLL